MDNRIDETFDHRTDSGGRDLDAFSPRLKAHHQILWNKPLPSGEFFELKPMSKRYLVHRTDDLAYSLSSDQISNSMRTTARMTHITSQVSPEDLDEFQYLGATLGGTILFPGKQINRKITINVARGWNRQIEDRFDLTLECIRRQYAGLPNPLAQTLEVYWKFFELFENFAQYSEFFLLQDLVENGRIKFYLPFEDFGPSALPSNLEAYLRYKQNSMDFVRARALRMKQWSEISPS
jgi:hypothetical protein